MSRLIDADALKKTLGISAEECDKCRWGDIRGRCSRSGDFEIVCCVIDEQPTISPKTGRWEEEPNCWYRCSECGEHYPSIKGHMDYNYCPNCGCRMVEVTE